MNEIQKSGIMSGLSSAANVRTVSTTPARSHDASLTTVLLATNIHCASCVAFVKDIIAFLSAVESVDVSILTQEVRIRHSLEIATSELAKALIDAAFEVQLATTYDEAGSLVTDFDTSTLLSAYPRVVPPALLSSSPDMLRRVSRDTAKLDLVERKHIENCDACRQEVAMREKPELHDLGVPTKPAQETVSSFPSAHQHRPHLSQNASNPISRSEKSERFEARISISGMTCAACVNSITESVQQLDFVDSASVTLLTNSAIVNYVGPKENIDKVLEEIECTGFEAAIDDIRSFQPSPSEYEVRFSVGGMSCASCVNSITSQVKQLHTVKDVSVSLIANSARVVFSGDRSEVEKIKGEIEDVGFDVSIEELRQISEHIEPAAGNYYTTNLSIGGMTCGACVGTITRGLRDLSFVNEVNVDLLSNCANLVFEEKNNLDKILETIGDLGYECTVVECVLVGAGDADIGVSTRTVMIRVNGMFCLHCPEKVLASLNYLSETSFEILQVPSMKDPVLKITYTPHSPDVTIRKILSAITSAHPAFHAQIYLPPTIEDRSRVIQLRERRRFLSRLVFVFIVAIPTFLIGIVFMSLVSSDNRVRIFLEQPIWTGTVSRMEWAMFIMTTPVMFYGADVFHIRAMKEIKALWRPGGKVPILRRFYRFGSMNLLISAGTLVAYIASLAVLIVGATVSTQSSANVPTYFDSVTFLTLFILAGRSLEAYSKSKAGDAVVALGKLRPTEALLVNDVEENASHPENEASGPRILRVDVDLLEIGDTVNIPHGASPPADGVVTTSGTYQFDESSLTGESRPVSKSTGDTVYSGSVNVGQQVSVRVTQLGGTSMLDKIVSVVREGQSRRAPLERVADLIVAYFVPVITLIAILTFALWFALGQSGSLPLGYLDNPLGGWAFWSLQFAVAVFVVACPCGLALAAPTALFVGVGLAAKRGILVRGGGEAFQEATRLDAIVFDKTGTLTEGGSLKVSDHEVLITDEGQESIAWTLAHELEQRSNHPIAKAISSFCAAKAKLSVISSDITEIPGQGMKGTFELSINGSQVSYEVAIGNERLARAIPPSGLDSYFFSNLLSKYQSSGKSTAILLMRQLSSDKPRSEFTPVIVFATSDPIRAESVHVVSQFQKRHINVFMCTGDNETTAHAVAATLGIPRSNVKANVLPDQKADFIHQVQEGAAVSESDGIPRRQIVAFVGDGTNDSPALTAADVSIAMASGSDVAINSSSFILLNSNLSTIFELVLLSHRVFARIKMNFVWAAVYNVILVPIAAGVLYPIPTGQAQQGSVTVNTHWRLDPVWAALAMALSSVSVVSSSLALRIEGWATIRGLFRWIARRES
jgi:heavy metal translocating P-type ATPase